MAILPAFESQTTLKPLTFDPAKLNGLSERLIRSHWENNYGGSVKALGVVKKHLSEALRPGWCSASIRIPASWRITGLPTTHMAQRRPCPCW